MQNRKRVFGHFFLNLLHKSVILYYSFPQLRHFVGRRMCDGKRDVDVDDESIL